MEPAATTPQFTSSKKFRKREISRRQDIKQKADVLMTISEESKDQINDQTIDMILGNKEYSDNVQTVLQSRPSEIVTKAKNSLGTSFDQN